ncbi:DUF1566 domain-containing protein [Dissulfurirhabdus thermomarina]|uniref:DUF1566 domain-containing protein n=1 Tax=Dissulfurirhabdus thermomarina TaxID=1765737 RepID=A0A6N9TLZ3_DISTH|nr:DUF1566 domain-containing protein [Dissulfurirhabdus thermomarina]NDY42139.1 DUF1566 domain-containing protein [Dissulfurirhabdus thermomarina]NMX23073.1 DUF1566 domain-containing protein [Dissulfurirhabdus thermomarina]
MAGTRAGGAVPPARGLLQTGQSRCYDAGGREIPCNGSGQDGQFRSGLAWPEPRFTRNGETVVDRATGLVWTLDANLAEFAVTWAEALAFVADMNRSAALGHRDWRLPNRRELRSLVSYQETRPPLPGGHPFVNVFPGWYWTSTSAAVNPAYAWAVHMDGARMFYPRKDQEALVWAVRGRGKALLPATGQARCFDVSGAEVPCGGTGQDGEHRSGAAWPVPRFEVRGDAVLDRLTGLYWARAADAAGPVEWETALRAAAAFPAAAGVRWRLPNINELESLVDCSRHTPALPAGHPFRGVQEVYWSATTSTYEPDWAWALYLHKGAVGVGWKPGARFHVWPVGDSSKLETDSVSR